MFRYKIDRLPVACVVGLSALDLIVYLTVDGFWMLLGYFLLSIVPKGIVSCWNHHHQHVATFRSDLLNRLYEVSLGLHTGVTTNLWVLHHVLGHHMNYLDQSKDESRWKRRDGSTMGVVEYSFSVAGTAYFRGYRVGRRYPRHQRRFLVWTTITFLVLAALIAYRPLPGLFLYVLPMVCTLIYTSWVTYEHHTGLEATSPFEASYNVTNHWYNVLTGNLGYHTAHHYRQAVHWSKLPELHAQIAHQIPDRLYRKSICDVFLPDVESSAPVRSSVSLEP